MNKPFFYGSEKEPKKAFGEGEMLAKFHEEAKNIAPHAYMTRNVMINSWNPMALHHTWVMPDGHVVHKRVWETKSTKLSIDLLDKRSLTFKHKVNQGTKKGVSLAADITHSVDSYVVREMQARCNYSTGALQYFQRLLSSMVSVDQITDRTKCLAMSSLDNLSEIDIRRMDTNTKARLLELVERSLAHRSHELVTVHDEFKCHANNVENMRSHYNWIMCELYHSDLLMDILEQITGIRYQNAPLNLTVANKILENSYGIN